MNQSRSALIVDDERDIRELLTLTLGRMGLRIDTAANLGEARELLGRNTYDLCFTDMRLPDGNGIDLVGEISRNYPNTPVAMITAFGNIELAVEALKAGAFDFVSKPVDLTVLRGLVQVSARQPSTPLSLQAGWQTRVDGQGAGRPTSIDVFLAQAWMRGILPAERMRLDQLLAELSRYRPGFLRCSEAVAALRVTGSFQLDDTDAALALVANTLPVRIERRTRYWVTVVPA